MSEIAEKKLDELKEGLVSPIVEIEGKKAIVFKLSDETEVIVFAGKGRHVTAAQKETKENPDQFITNLMSKLVTIAGKKVIPEDLEDLSIRDFMALQVNFSTLNFT